MNTDLYTAIDIYFLYNDDGTMEKWNKLSFEEKIYYYNFTIFINRKIITKKCI